LIPTAIPTKRPKVTPRAVPKPVATPAPRWQVILLDDDDHTYQYVMEMLQELFGHSLEKAYLLACDVDAQGRVVVDTTTRERAELKRDQIHAYGTDWRITRCAGSMSARIEPFD
jgi:ATP-dependent Clp protease adaptor protein ClpS